MAKTWLYEDKARCHIEHPEHMIVKPPKTLAVISKDGAQDDAKTHAAHARKDSKRTVKRPRRHLGLDDVVNAACVLIERRRAKGGENGAPTAHVLVGIIKHKRAWPYNRGYRVSACAWLKYRAWGGEHGAYVFRV
jgi:hypothetical protein